MSRTSMLRLLAAAALGGLLVGGCVLEREGSQSGLPESETHDPPPADSNQDATSMRKPTLDVTPEQPSSAPQMDSGLQTDALLLDAGDAAPILPVMPTPDAGLSASSPMAAAPAGTLPVNKPEAARPQVAPATETSTSDSEQARAPQLPAQAPAQPQPQPLAEPEAPPPTQLPPQQLFLKASNDAFEEGGSLPRSYACDGVAPPLRWGSPPMGTTAYTLSLTEIDGAERRTIWALNNMPSFTESLGPGSAGLTRYGTPRCSVGARYEYTLYALSRSSQAVTRTEYIGGVLVSTFSPPDAVLSSATLTAYFTGR